MEALPSQLVDVLSTARVKHFPKGQIILYEGDIPSEIFILKNGIVKIYDIDEQGNEKILHIVKTPALIPFIFFSGDNSGTQWFYTALTDCDTYVLPQEKLNQALENSSALTIYLMNWFSREVHELLVRLSSLGKTNTRNKLSAVLKFLAVHHSSKRQNGWRRISFPVSHQLLADMVGITRESTAMVMKELQETKIVRSPRLTVLEINFDKLIS